MIARAWTAALHRHADAGNLLLRYDRPTFTALEAGFILNELAKASTKVRLDFRMPDEGEGHGLTGRMTAASTTQETER